VSGTSGTGIGRVPTGIPGFDTVLNGGFLTGGLYIVQGTPGTGQTTLANQICFHHIARGGRVLYTTLLAEYHGRMMQHLGACRSSTCRGSPTNSPTSTASARCGRAATT